MSRESMNEQGWAQMSKNEREQVLAQTSGDKYKQAQTSRDMHGQVGTNGENMNEWGHAQMRKNKQEWVLTFFSTDFSAVFARI